MALNSKMFCWMNWSFPCNNTLIDMNNHAINTYTYTVYIYIFLIQSIYIRTYSSLHSNNLCKVVSC